MGQSRRRLRKWEPSASVYELVAAAKVKKNQGGRGPCWEQAENGGMSIATMHIFSSTKAGFQTRTWERKQYTSRSANSVPAKRVPGRPNMAYFTWAISGKAGVDHQLDLHHPAWAPWETTASAHSFSQRVTNFCLGPCWWCYFGRFWTI